jgi:hypothetical protein
MKEWTKAQKLVARVIITGLMVLVFALAFRDFYQVAAGTQNWVGKFTLTWGLPLAGLIALGIVSTFWGLAWVWLPGKIAPLNRFVARWRDWLGWLRWPLVIALPLILAKIFLYTPLGFKLTAVSFRFAFFLAIVVAMALLASHGEKLFQWRPLLLVVLFAGAVLIFAKEFASVTSYPLSLTWSEGNRIWDYSILYGRDLYNYPADQRIEAYIDRGRQALWGLPFLFRRVSIVHVRLWSALVFTIPYALLGWMTFRPLPDRLKQWGWLGIWTFLFLYQGPIYTPLVLSAILVAGARWKPLWIGLPLIYLAGYYAQMSRISWMVAPAMWAVMLALGDGFSKTSQSRNLTWQDWGKVILYGLAGFLGGFGLVRGWRRVFSTLELASEPEAITPSLGDSEPGFAEPATNVVDPVSATGGGNFLTDQPLLWERLWPNPTYGLGLILGLILAVAPLVILLVYLIRSRRWKLNLWQQLGIGSILSAFLAAGLVISVKIGGGSNLHNLDMFLIGLIFAAALAWEHGGHQLLARLNEQPVWLNLVLLAAVLIPAFMPLVKATPLELPPQDKLDWTMKLLRAETQRITEEGGEILFMDQRQLLTFGYLGDIPLVPEYEKKKVMDKALSGDRDYFADFYADLAAQRFDLIITDPQRIRYADEDESWGAENDAWVHWVTEPLLCYYQPVYTIKKTSVWFLYPREEVGDCSVP